MQLPICPTAHHAHMAPGQSPQKPWDHGTVAARGWGCSRGRPMIHSVHVSPCRTGACSQPQAWLHIVTALWFWRLHGDQLGDAWTGHAAAWMEWGPWQVESCIKGLGWWQRGARARAELWCAPCNQHLSQRHMGSRSQLCPSYTPSPMLSHQPQDPQPRLPPASGQAGPRDLLEARQIPSRCWIQPTSLILPIPALVHARLGHHVKISRVLVSIPN